MDRATLEEGAIKETSRICGRFISYIALSYSPVHWALWLMLGQRDGRL